MDTETHSQMEEFMGWWWRTNQALKSRSGKEMQFREARDRFDDFVRLTVADQQRMSLKAA